MVIDDFSSPPAPACNAARWQVFTDQVMGGVSRGSASVETVAGRPAIRMRGSVSLDNNGGFVQISRDLAPDGGPVDASGFSGIEVTVSGNGERYNVHLRTAQTRRPWQSYRHEFIAAPTWQKLQFPFAGFTLHRIEAALDLGTLRRIGLVAIGREFDADLSVSRVAFF
ncbi:MAG: NADH:ubiquinone oxidoreductase [Alphaproteobacteria bacterium BRH_c36]|nr:MAG: NADH:ubiquinone oxidoreductase [Alphaproteobacteria bacterium BRH_c36]